MIQAYSIDSAVLEQKGRIQVNSAKSLRRYWLKSTYKIVYDNLVVKLVVQQSWARDSTAGTTWPNFNANKLLIIELHYVYNSLWLLHLDTEEARLRCRVISLWQLKKSVACPALATCTTYHTEPAEYHMSSIVFLLKSYKILQVFAHPSFKKVHLGKPKNV